MARLVQHMKKEHESVIRKTKHFESCIPVKDEDFQKAGIWTEDHITFKDHHFFGECWRSLCGQWTFWVYKLGSNKDCEEQAYTIRVFAKIGNKKTEYVYRGQCVPLDINKKQVASSGNCLILTDAAVKRLIVKNEILYSVTIE